MASDSLASSPLESEKYLASPIATILESVNDPQSEVITLHDLTEAYATLSRRIRLQASMILMNKRVYPALSPLQAESHTLTICLIRDIGRCLLNPLSIFSQPESTSDDGLLIEEGAERAQAYATLSHHALVFLSDVFSFISLTKTFSTDQLSDLLRELLLILLTPRLPTPSSKKTWSLAVWVLVSQRLHPDVWLPHKRAMQKVLLRLVRDTFDGHSFRADGLKLLSILLRISPSEFLHCLLHLYTHVLSSCLEGTLDVKLQSLEILCSVAALKHDSPNTKWSEKLALETTNFIKSQHQSSQDGPLHALLKSAMADSRDSQWGNKGPLWAVLFVACLICISDTHLFTHRESLKLVMPVLAHAADHKRTYIRALHPHVWNCLVWCYSRLPRNGGMDSHTGRDLKGVRKNAFKLVKQELKSGIVTVVVASVLSTSSTITKKDIGRVLDLIRETLASNKESQIREGVMLFRRLLSNVGAPSNTIGPSQARNDIRSFSDIVIRDLFTGSFLDLPESQMRALLMRLPGPDERFVRPFTEEQIRGNWRGLVELWVYAVECTRVPNIRFKQYEDQLMTIWQSLLLVQSHLTADSSTTVLSMSPTTSDFVTSVVLSFIKPGNDSDVKKAEDQLQELTLMHKLWSVVKRCYGTAFLVSEAETLLVTILSMNVMPAYEAVTGTWGALCVDLVSAIGKPEVLVQSVFTRNGEQQEGIKIKVEIQRQLWVAIAASELFRTKEQKWEEILSFLVVPIRLWSMDPHEVDVWNKLFNVALDIAHTSSGMPHDTLNAFFHKLGGDVTHLKACPSLIPFLLQHLHFNPANLLHLDFLSIINELLVKMYPPTPEDHIVALPILEGLARVVQSCEGNVVARLLAVLKDGLGLWIRDEAKTLLESEHTSVVRSIYCASLTTLSTLPPSLQTLQNLSSFLSSSFERMGYPPIGPLAFEQYWRKGGYHDQDSSSFKKLIPEALKTCLKAWSDHCGDSLAEGCTSVMDSQSTTRSYEPDSQSPDKGFILGSEDYEFMGAVGSDDDIYDLVAPSSDPAPVMFSQRTPTGELLRESTPRPSHQQHQQQVSPAFPAAEAITGHKRSSSTGYSRPVKRQRTGDVRASSPIPPSEQLHSSSPELSSSHKPVQPRISQPQHSPPRQQRRRTIVSPTPPPGDDFVPETSSPTGPITPSSPIHTPVISPKYHDEVVDDSMQMDLVDSLVHQENELQLSNKSNLSNKRPQSEPVIESHPPSRPSLKRNHTTTERLGALERAYTLVAESQGASQVPLEELAHAAQIAHQIGAKIAEQMSKKFPELERS